VGQSTRDANETRHYVTEAKTKGFEFKAESETGALPVKPRPEDVWIM